MIRACLQGGLLELQDTARAVTAGDKAKLPLAELALLKSAFEMTELSGTAPSKASED